MTTIYTPQNPSPRNEVRDMSINQNITCTVDGIRYTDYQIRFYRVSDNVLVHDTTKINLTTPLANGQVLTHVLAGGTLTNSTTESYKWTIQVWNGAETKTSREFQFSAKTTPVLTFTVPATITSQSYEFTATIVQAEGDIVNNYTFELYDSQDVFIESSGSVTDFNIQYTFEGFTNGDNLKVRLFGTTTGGQSFDSGLVSFDVAYSEPSLIIVPEAEVDSNTSLIRVERGNVVQILGSTTGTTSYHQNFIYDGNYGLNLAQDTSYVSFNVSIPSAFTISFKWMPLSNLFQGKILTLDDTGYEFGYELGKFYYKVGGGDKQYSEEVDILGSVFYLTLTPNWAFFSRTQFFESWSNLSYQFWNEIGAQTFEDIGVLL